MCTLSWLPEPDGFVLYFNRDERHTRAPAHPPALSHHAGMARLAPTDGDFGGTWIGVNERGVAAAILNRYEDTPVNASDGQVSRGLLLASLLAEPSAARLIARVAEERVADYRPFTICAVAPGTRLLTVDWSGSALTHAEIATPGLARTSSGRDQREAERLRTATWRQLVEREGGPTADLLARLHRSHVPARGPLSVCMHREEASTQSLSIIRVDGQQASFTYVPGPPCQAAPPVVLDLPLRTTP